MDVPSLGAMVLANSPLEARMKFIRDICVSLNIAHLHFDLKLTGTIGDPVADEIIIMFDGFENRDVTEHLSYDKILTFMAKGCDSEEPLLRKDVIKARNIMINIWKKTTGVQLIYILGLQTWRAWMEQEKWVYQIVDKVESLVESIDRGPKNFKICCSDDVDDQSKDILFWNSVFDDHCYETYANYWLV